MSEFLDFNEVRGSWTETDYNAHEDKLYIHTKQDVDPVLARMKRERDSGIGDSKIKQEFAHYASIPAAVEYEIKVNHGVSIYDKNDTKKLLKIINTEYPYLKTCNWTHNIK